MNVTIVGVGNMGRALSTRFLAGRHALALVDRDRRQAESVASELRNDLGDNAVVEGADLEGAIEGSAVVILALPYPSALDVAREHGRLMGDRVVVDVSIPLNETGTGLVTEGGPSAAETLRTFLPPDVRLVKAFNTTFARTLVAGEVSGQPLDVFIAGDDEAANTQVANLVRDGGMRPIVVGPLERARQLEALGFLGISMQEPLGTGFMTAWKLVFPGTEAPEGRGFPRDAVVAVMPGTGNVGQITTELAAIGVEPSHVHLVMGADGAAVLRNAKLATGTLASFLFGFEAEHTRRHLDEVEAGNALILVQVADDQLGTRVGEVLARHGAHFINYYSRWTAKNLLP